MYLPTNTKPPLRSTDKKWNCPATLPASPTAVFSGNDNFLTGNITQERKGLPTFFQNCWIATQVININYPLTFSIGNQPKK